MSDPVECLSVDNLDFGLVAMSHDLAITGLNAKARLIFGAENLPASKIPASEIPRALKKIVCVDNAPIMHFHCEVAGSERWFERTRVPGGKKGGLPEGWLFVLYEITDLKKQHEAQLRDLHERCERKSSQQWTMLLQDLHDGVGSISNSIGMLAALAKTRPEAEDKDKFLTQIGALARECNIEIQTIMNTLEVEQFSWDELFSQVRRFSLLVLEPRDMKFVFQVEGSVPPEDPDISETLSLFRIVKEAVTNAAKHSCCATVEVRFAFEEACLTLSVRDDGKWAEERSGGRGLRHIRKRVQNLRGEFLLEKKPQTRLLCKIPLPMNLHVAERGDA